MLTAEQALKRLKTGNNRFVAEKSIATHELKDGLAAKGQKPFAIVIGCSDSRVPIEAIFDQGIGTLFVIRVAGNIVAPSQVGSVEFAADRFGTQLVVILGHSNCGAVSATIEELNQPTGNQSRNLRSIVDRIGPAVRPLLDPELNLSPEKLIQTAVRANVYASMNNLRHGSELLEQLIIKKEVVVVGAEYDLQTGIVDFFDTPDIVQT